MSDPREQIRKAAGWALVGGLSVAAFTAIVALMAGDFDDTEVRVILSSLGFAIGQLAGRRGRRSALPRFRRLRALGTATAALAGGRVRPAAGGALDRRLGQRGDLAQLGVRGAAGGRRLARLRRPGRPAQLGHHAVAACW